MRRVILLSLLLLNGFIFATSAPVYAADTLRISAKVKPVRMIYVDGNNHIQKVLGNTDQNIEPTIVEGTQAIAINSAIAKQYQLLLGMNGNSLQAGQTYSVFAPTAASSTIQTHNIYRRLLRKITSEALLFQRLYQPS